VEKIEIKELRMKKVQNTTDKSKPNHIDTEDEVHERTPESQ
jgi:hypothetical protein